MAEALSLSKVFNTQAGWYRGEFHAHTNYSDGEHTPDELVEVARAEGLDFIVVTDHNTISAFVEFGDQREVLVIPGMKLPSATATSMSSAWRGGPSGWRALSMMGT